MKKFLLSTLCLLALAFNANAETLLVTFGGNDKYTGEPTSSKVAFDDTAIDVDNYVFSLPDFGSFTVTRTEGADLTKQNAISKGGSGGNPHIAVYKNSVVDFSLNAGITVSKIVIACPTAKYTLDLTPSTGTCKTDTQAKTITWEGEATTSLKFTNTAGAERYMYFLITYSTTGSSNVDEITADTCESAQYFNMQGISVANPEHGIYIRKQGSDIRKVYVK